jgi:streptogramin lyase
MNEYDGAIRRDEIAKGRPSARRSFSGTTPRSIAAVAFGVGVWTLAVTLAAIPTPTYAIDPLGAAVDASAAQPAAATPLIRGYPVILAAGEGGGVWYGGATDASGGTVAGPPDFVERVDYIAPTGIFQDFEFPSQLAAHYPRYFAPGTNGQEWFLADENEEPTPILGEVSPLGTISAQVLSVNPKSDIRGLAMGPEGDLWTTATRRQGRARISSILRITPAGEVSEFSRGLLKGAVPANITVGPDTAMWFTDTVGRIGRIDADGVIHEFPIGRPIFSAGRPPFEPSRPIVAGPKQSLWFIAGANAIGRISTSGHVRFFTPHSSYRGYEALGDRGELVGLATGPDGDLWFTRESGEVARMDGSGHVTTLTNRLVKAYGIAFGNGGVAWVGEGPRYIFGVDVREGELPARVARISPSGRVQQLPKLPVCHVPRLLGLERAFAAGALHNYLVPECSRLHLGHITIRQVHRRGRLIVVSQTPRVGTPTVGYGGVNVTLAPAPPIPKRCRPPAFYQVLVDTPRLVVWKIKRGTRAHDTESFTENYYACAPPKGRKRVIATACSQGTSGGAIEALSSAGSVVGVTSSGGNQYGSSETLAVYNLATGRKFIITVSNYSEGSSSPTEGPEELAKLGKPAGQGAEPFVLNPNGDVAWLGKTEPSSTQPSQWVVYLHDQHGTRRVTAGPDISNLAFAGTLLTWRSAGVTQSAPA